MGKIPFSTVELNLKQINLSELSNHAPEVMSFLFGRFADTRLTDEELSAKSMRANTFFGNKVKFDHESFDQSLSRRYAGDNTLPRGRYYSLANDDSGDDSGTMLYELMAYCYPKEPGLTEIWDLTLPHHYKIINDLFKQVTNSSEGYAKNNSLLISLLPLDGRSHPLGSKMERSL